MNEELQLQGEQTCKPNPTLNVSSAANPATNTDVNPVDGYKSSVLIVNQPRFEIGTGWQLCACPYTCNARRFWPFKRCMVCILANCLEGGQDA